MNLNFAMLAQNQLWAIVPDTLEAICNSLATKNNLQAEIETKKALTRFIADDQLSKTAIIEIIGPIVRYNDVFSALLGASSIERIQGDLQDAITNPLIETIVLDIDSPGGTVAGVHDLANTIYSARSIKPITAYVSSLGASAAYWLASSADEIVLDATAAVGSIGVISTCIDDSERKAKAGIKEISIVSSHSPNKNLDTNTDNGRAAMQSLVDSIADVFVADVARNRNVSIETVLADFGQGGLLVGEQAIKAGLADRLGSLSDVIQSLTNRGKSTMTTSVEATAASDIKSVLPTLTLEQLTAQYPSIATALRLEGAVLERERIQTIEQQLIPGHEALINQLKYDGKTTGIEAAVQVLRAEKAQHVSHLKELRNDNPPQVSASDSIAGEANQPINSNLPFDEQLEQEWRNSSVLQDEFVTKTAYIAYRQAESQGLIKIAGQKA